MAEVTVRDLKRTYWARIIAQCTKDRMENGGTIAQWCVDHGVSERSYWYYHKKIGDQLAEEFIEQESNSTAVIPSVSFLPLEPPEQKTAKPVETKTILRNGNLSVEINESVSDTFLERLIRMMAHA